jgi:hypothetical protein
VVALQAGTCYNLSMTLIRRFRSFDLPTATHTTLLESARRLMGANVEDITAEHCFYIEAERELSAAQWRSLDWLLAETFEPHRYGAASFLDAGRGVVLEVGPRMSFTTAWSTNAVSICRACGIDAVRRIERSRRWLVRTAAAVSEAAGREFLAPLHDRMTETRYPEPLTSFATGIVPEPVATVPVLADGRAALERLNRELGLAFDDWDLDYYTSLFRDRMRRDPTDVECFDIAQSNSEHSRHWFFKGRLVIDGEPAPQHLFAIVRRPWEGEPQQQRHRLPRQLERHPRLSDHCPGQQRSPRAGAAGHRRARARRDPDRRDPQLPLRRGAVPGRRDRHRRPHPRHPRHRARLAGGGRDRRLLRRQPAAARLSAAVGGRSLPLPRPTSPRRGRSRSRPPTGLRTTATSSASR